MSLRTIRPRYISAAVVVCFALLHASYASAQVSFDSGQEQLTGPSAEPPSVADETQAAAPDAQSTDYEQPTDSAPPPVPSSAAPPVVAPPPDTKTGDPLGVTWKPSAQIRPRGELRIDPYLSTVGDQHFVISRVRVGLEAQKGPISALIQIQDVREFGAAQVGLDDGSFLGLHQGYMQLELGTGWLRLGRQEINFGTERMMGALDWSGPGRSFDTLRVHQTFGKLDIDLLGALVRRQRALASTASAAALDTQGDYLSALYLTYHAFDALTGEAYVLYRHDGPTTDAAGNPVDQKRNIAAPGLHLYGKPVAGLSYDVEAVVQTGEVNGKNHFAYAFAGDATYALDEPYKPAFTLGGAYATGASKDGDVDEFDNFFPTNHKFYGYADLFGLRNLIYAWGRLAAAVPGQPLRATLDFHRFALAEKSARWSDAGGATVGQSAASGSALLGHEVDLTAYWQALDPVNLSLGYALFLPASGAERLGHPDPTHWAFLMVDTRL